MEFIRKARTVGDAFFCEKSIKPDIYAERFALTAVKMKLIADRAVYKNAQILTPVRFTLTLFLELICIKIIAERFALLK